MKVVIEDKALKYIFAMCHVEHDNEFMMYLLGQVDQDGIYTVKDVFFPEQTANSTFVEDKDNELFKFFESGQLNDNDKVLGWVHTHPDMNSFLSGTDNDQIDNYFVGGMTEVLSIVLAPFKELDENMFKDRMLFSIPEQHLLTLECKAWISHIFRNKRYDTEVSVHVSGNIQSISSIDDSILKEVKEMHKKKHNVPKKVITKPTITTYQSHYPKHYYNWYDSFQSKKHDDDDEKELVEKFNYLFLTFLRKYSLFDIEKRYKDLYSMLNIKDLAQEIKYFQTLFDIRVDLVDTLSDKTIEFFLHAIETFFSMSDEEKARNKIYGVKKV